jgi:hypothetical protein
MTYASYIAICDLRSLRDGLRGKAGWKRKKFCPRRRRDALFLVRSGAQFKKSKALSTGRSRSARLSGARNHRHNVSPAKKV